MLRNLERIPIRIAVTGSRGKSSLTRLLHAGFTACGFPAYARITGVIPRELSPQAERPIRRTSPANIREMHWWLSQIPEDAQALIVENSAVNSDLQSYAPGLVSPTLAVWTTLRADHVEVWGPGREGAARTLLQGIPRGVPVAGGTELQTPPLPLLFEENGNALYTPESSGLTSHNMENLALARLALRLCQSTLDTIPGNPILDLEKATAAMAALPPDIADFRILRNGTDELALAFSANDVESTARLFAETAWHSEETTLLYHHRPDRYARLENFLPWIEAHPWREKVFTRVSRPLVSFRSPVKWDDTVNTPAGFENWWKGRGRVFACGNVAGWPIEFLRQLNLEAP